MTGRPRSSEDLTAKAYRRLRLMIVNGDVVPRQRLSHRTLSRELGIGRSPVRDALLQLEAEGLIEHRPSSGIYLREITVQELDSLYDLRIATETHAAEQAATRATAMQVELLARICEEMTAIAAKPDLVAWFSETANRRRLCRIDMQFHMTVLEAAGNLVTCKLLANPHLMAMKFAWDLGHGQPDWYADGIARTEKGHRAIFEAIRDREPRAARDAMLEHITWARIEIPERVATLKRQDRFKPLRGTRRGRQPGSRGKPRHAADGGLPDGGAPTP